MTGAEPADDFDRLRRRVLWTMPTGLYVVGAADGDRLNAMTLNLATQVSIEPKRIGIAVLKTAFTHELIEGGGAFSLCILDRQDRAIVRKFVKPVEVDTKEATLNGFGFRRAKTGSPVLSAAHAALDCTVWKAVDAGDHTFFVGDVVDAFFQTEEGADILRMEDTRMNYGG